MSSPYIHCKNTRSSSAQSVYAFNHVRRYGMAWPDRQKAIGPSYLLRLSDERSVVVVDTEVGPEDTLSETHSAHTEERAPYTCILAVGPIPASDKTTSLVSDVRAKTKAAMNPTLIIPHDRLSRDNEDRSHCYVDLYRGSDVSWRPEARKIRERTKHSYRCRSEDTRAMIERPPRCRSMDGFRTV